ncbi:tryptophan synthase subunit alpha [Anaerostipes caccae]|uniref:tryptophan synthase subunit alpha n=1 Tax=Anaerostipes caccae TaxID=105841 RepID=UPI0022E77C51|nr:tryptophan synthase subunit alpha [Anaerostipes caccae]
MKDLVLYMTIGYPDENTFFRMLDMLDEEKVPVLELGIPVGNPFVDGDLIRQSHKKVLDSGIGQKKIIRWLQRIRRDYKFCIILMTYKEGMERFCLSELDKNLYDGILCVDEVIRADTGMRPVQIYNETMTEVQMLSLLAENKNFAYVMSGNGKTGSFSCLPDGYKRTVHFLKKNTNLPVYVGFGIKTLKDVNAVCSHGADGVIIGSHFMRIMSEKGCLECKKYINIINNYLQKTALQP